MDRLAAMQTFVKVIETGSFSAAARQLRLGQPAISKTVAQLEERLGLPLLLRSSRRLSATEAGQIFYDHAKVTIAQAEEAELAARGAGAGLTGRLRVSAGVTFARLKIVPKLGSFLAKHPKLEMELILDDRNVDLVGEGIDVALRLGVLTDSALAARKIAVVGRRVVGTPAYFARAGVPEMPADLSAHEAIIYSQRGGGSAWTFAKDGVEQAVVLSGRIAPQRWRPCARRFSRIWGSRSPAMPCWARSSRAVRCRRCWRIGAFPPSMSGPCSPPAGAPAPRPAPLPVSSSRSSRGNTSAERFLRGRDRSR
jgi:DNA-binding transcriptional LysR family regulator